MTVKTILCCLMTRQHADDVLKVAVPLARRCGAHLIGLHTLEAIEVYPGIAIHVTDAMMESIGMSQKEEAAAVKARFETHTEGDTFVSEFRALKARAARASERMIESARAADLVIMAHEDKESDRYDQRRAQADLIRQSGRPVIVVPLGHEGPEIGRRIVIGWSDTREAARAAHDALSVAAPGAEIELIRVQKGGTDALHDHDLMDMSAALARHGHTVTTRHLETSDLGVAETLMSAAFETGADLIVTGAFGHSAFYDIVVGASSRTLLREAKIPVLFSK